VTRYGPWFLALLFVIVWVALIHFLAVDGCLDAGGGVAEGRLNCETSSDKVVSLAHYVGAVEVIVAALLAAIPVGPILSIVHGGRSG
jgi:hypothetical protein